MTSSFGYKPEYSGLRLTGLSDTTIAAPANGQVLAYDNGVWKNSADTSGGPPRVTNVTASGNFTFQSNTKYVEIRAWGGGGEGGGAEAGANVSIGAPGGSGGYIQCYAPLPEGTCSIVIGAGGVQVSGAQGGAGGDTTVTWTSGATVLAAGASGGNAVSGASPLAGLSQPLIAYNHVFTTSSASAEFTVVQNRQGNMSQYSIVYVGSGMSVRPRNLNPEITSTTLTTINSIPVALSGQSAGANTGEGGGGAINTDGTVASPGGNGGSGFVQIVEYS